MFSLSDTQILALWLDLLTDALFVVVVILAGIWFWRNK